MFYVAGAKAKLALHLQTSGRRGLGMLCLEEGTDTHIVAHSISTLGRHRRYCRNLFYCKFDRL